MTDIGIFKLSCTIIFDAMVVISEIVSVFLTVFCAAIMLLRKRGFPSQTKTFRTKRDAETWAKVTESEMVRGVFVQRTEAERTLLSELLDRYAKEVVPTLKGGSRDLSRIRTLKTHLGRYAVASITSALVAQYRDSRLATISQSTGKLVGPQTVKHELGMLQRVLKKGAQEWGYCFQAAYRLCK